MYFLYYEALPITDHLWDQRHSFLPTTVSTFLRSPQFFWTPYHHSREGESVGFRTWASVRLDNAPLGHHSHHLWTGTLTWGPLFLARKWLRHIVTLDLKFSSHTSPSGPWPPWGYLKSVSLPYWWETTFTKRCFIRADYVKRISGMGAVAYVQGAVCWWWASTTADKSFWRLNWMLILW